MRALKWSKLSALFSRLTYLHGNGEGAQQLVTLQALIHGIFFLLSKKFKFKVAKDENREYLRLKLSGFVKLDVRKCILSRTVLFLL